MFVRDVIQKTTAFFKDKGIETARLDAEILIARALKWERIQLYLKFDYPMSDAELAACRESVRRRSQGEPVAYIVGERDFYDSTFFVEPGVLVPRPETEGLVELALAFARARENVDAPFRAVDLGCGSGCIGLSIAKALPNARVLCVDASDVAERIARRNAEALGVSDRGHVVRARAEDLERAFAEGALGGEVDAVLANPPYVAEGDPRLAPDVKKHEPALALYSGEGGLAHIRAWAGKAAKLARPGGLVAFETGSDQGEAAREIFGQIEDPFASRPRRAYENAEIIKDLAGHDRFVRALRAGGAKREASDG